MTIKDFGAQVERVWEGLRPVTRKMLVGAMQTKSTAPRAKYSYDIQADWELSELLTALDAQANDSEVRNNVSASNEIKHLAETVVDVLEEQSESAEVFIQLAERALKQRDYKQIDKITDALLERFSVAEMCEIVRQTENPAIRALSFETLALMPTQKILELIEDPLYEDIVRLAIEQQAFEFENEQARHVLNHLDYIDEMAE